MSEQEKMLKQIELLNSCVQFYASLDNWRAVTIHGSPTMNTEDNELTDPHEDYYCRRGGKNARQTLEKIKEIK